MRWWAASFLCLMMVACHSSYRPFTQPDPVSVNQEFMISELQRFEPMLGIGSYIGAFSSPPNSTYAGWVLCNPGGHPPWYVYFNRDYIESLDPQADRSYMSALVAHEMCHHWVTTHHLNCYNEAAADSCAYNLVSFGRPN